jgi:hypothetical protein
MNSTTFYEKTHKNNESNSHQQNSPPVFLKKKTAVNIQHCNKPDWLVSLC